ncbi:MAG: hypothetical protein MZW92_37090 [Comamonadaceae bacterium]|nr:hypothetical protein [Comamonadaceae bacterium]
MRGRGRAAQRTAPARARAVHRVRRGAGETAGLRGARRGEPASAGCTTESARRGVLAGRAPPGRRTGRPGVLRGHGAGLGAAHGQAHGQAPGRGAGAALGAWTSMPSMHSAVPMPSGRAVRSWR